MAYNTKPIVTDKDGNPISQYFNDTTDSYEPVTGLHGANKVLVENNDLSLLPILDKLGQLTGTVIDEEVRKSNELQRIELYNTISQLLSDGKLKGDKGDKGDTGIGLEFNWQGTKLGIRLDVESTYIYVDLKGEQGVRGIQGIQGVQGIVGPTGIQGLKGERGLKGDIGPQGERGPQGDPGPQGLQGDEGETGPQGLQGIMGIQGLQGVTGDTGPRGLQGLQGVKGNVGPKGDKGDKGDSGVSVDISGHYYFSVENGNLYIHYPDDGSPPNFTINSNGELIYTM